MSTEHTTGTRKSDPATGAHAGKGVAGLAVAWKVAAFLPLVLTGAVLAGRIDLGTDDSAPTPSANSLIAARTPGALQDRDNRPADDGKGDRKKRDKPRASDEPTDEDTGLPTLASPSSSPLPDPDPTSPTKSPTKSPNHSPSPSPTDTPTPEEAAEACEEAGVNPLDLEAMAECVADMLGD